MTFKDQIAKDNETVFMNEEEFSERHVVNGIEQPCIIDNNEMIDREKRYQYKRSLYADGVFISAKLIYVMAKYFGALPAVGRSLTLDKKTYIISDAINEDGIYSIYLEANRTS